MWSDNETSEDLLGFKVHADLLIDIINDEKVLPITIGVFGDWGSGKSSVLKIINEEYEKEANKDSLCIFFNGWTFEGYDDAKAALLNSILTQLENNKKLTEEVKETIKEKAKKLWKSIDWMRGAGMLLKNVALPAVTAYFSGGASLVPLALQKMSQWGDDPQTILSKLQSEEGAELLKELLKEKEENTKSGINAIAEFRNDFEDLLEATNFKRLVVIIDDLDRCSPERIIENLESIKLFLNVPRTAYVIGADPRIVKYAIEHKYKNNRDIEEENNRIVIDYLEKLIQLPYFLPKLSGAEVETYISMLICKSEIESIEFKHVLQTFIDFRVQNRYSAFGLSNFKEILKTESFTKVKGSVVTIPALAPLIANSLYGNPRQIKRFLNTYTIRKRLAKVASINDFNDSILAKLMILEYSEPKLFKTLFDWQSNQEGVSKEILTLEKRCDDKNVDELVAQIRETEYKDWARPKIIRWLQVEPALADVDLRDYYWIAREKLTSSITASSLVPPVVRSIFTQLMQDNMTTSVTKSILDDKFRPLSGLEKDAFFQVLSSALKKTPKQKRLYELFNSMMDENIENTAYHYKNTLQLVSANDIEPSIAIRLADYKTHTDIGEFLIELFKNSTSKAAKAFNLKK